MPVPSSASAPQVSSCLRRATSTTSLSRSSWNRGWRCRRLRWSVFVVTSAERVTYLDSSAIVKLAVRETESAALRRYLRRRGPLVSSALARTEVARALLHLGATAVGRGHGVLDRIELARVSARVLTAAGALLPAELGSLDAIHLATARLFGTDLARIVTYDGRMAAAAKALGWSVAAPS
jgi:predicted nucleic acid-binding protein